LVNGHHENRQRLKRRINGAEQQQPKHQRSDE
jgi:hypothetical protein